MHSYLKSEKTIKPLELLLIGLFLFFVSCGKSQHKMAEQPVSLAVVAFSGDNLAGNIENINRKLVHALNASGSFRVNVINVKPALWNLQDMPSADSSGRYVLTGQFISESITEEKGKHIPFVAYFPKVKYSVSAEVRLYDSQTRRWILIQNIKGKTYRKGNPQLLDYDTSDPSLAVSAKDRQLLRNEAYNRLFYKMVKLLKEELENPGKDGK